ncbi:MAG: MmgE/PrpD family protein [Promethearchaeota archaeon]|nr:MAG: MmgE/PrpD family protein [Candidatus Lokiarchaeota archaeon]
MATLTEKIAKYSHEMKFEHIPKKTLDIAKMQLMNIIATMFAGSTTRPGEITYEAFKDSGGNPKASIISKSEKVSIDKAVLINSVFAQALDYEDYGMPMHSGCTVGPVSLAFVEAFELSGKDLILGMVLGNEINCKIGLSLFPSVTTGQTMDPLVHPISAAVMGAKLMGLNLEQMTNAIGIAAFLPQYPVLKGFFGPHSKVLTSALPAQNGVIASQLASKGLSGSHNIFTAPDGFINFMGDMPAPDRVELILDYETWMTNTLSFKLYPGCAYLDAPLDCVFEIIDKNPDIDPNSIKSIKVKLPGLGTVSMDMSDRPDATLEGLKKPDSCYAILNFNVPYNIAAALVDKELTPKQFTDERIFDPKIHDLAKKVEVDTDTAMTLKIFQSFLPSGFNISDINPEKINSLMIEALRGDFKWEFGARVIIKTENGKKYRASTDIAKGSPGNHKKEYIIQKFKQESKYIGLDEAKTGEIINLIDNIEELDLINDLLKLIT